MGVATGGLGAYAGGTALDAYGQSEALRALQGVWANQGAEQTGYSNQLQQQQQQLIGQNSLAQVLGQPTALSTLNTSNAMANNTANAAKAQLGKKSAGSQSGPGYQSLAGAAQQGSLAQVLHSNIVQAILAGLEHGRQTSAASSRQYQLNAGKIKGDANSYASLAPSQEAAAGDKGAWARQLGQLFQAGGMYGMEKGITAPPAPGPYNPAPRPPPPSLSQASAGGFMPSGFQQPWSFQGGQ